MLTRDGWMLAQDDPLEHAVEFVVAQVDGVERVFLYDVTTTEADHDGRVTEVAWYREEE